MAEITQHQMISAKLSELREQLLANHPQMPLLLRDIHRVTKEDPSTVTLLAEEDILAIVNGLERQTNTYIAQSMTAKSPSKTKALRNVSSTDLGFD